MKEFIVAEYGHEEKKSLGKRVGMRKSNQISSKISTEDARANKRMPKYQDSPKDAAIAVNRNARKRERQSYNRAISSAEEKALSSYAESIFPSEAPATGVNALSMDECRELF